jgi:hypothetical protein
MKRMEKLNTKTWVEENLHKGGYCNKSWRVKIHNKANAYREIVNHWGFVLRWICWTYNVIVIFQSYTFQV